MDTKTDGLVPFTLMCVHVTYSPFTLEITTTGYHAGNDDNKCHDNNKTSSCYHAIKLEGEKRRERERERDRERERESSSCD